MLISGSAGDYFGRKNLYLWSVAGYTLSILLSALSPNGVLFLIAKGTAFIGFIQGIASVLGGIVFSLAIGKGVAFSLATTFVYGVLLLWITVVHYKEPVKINATHHEV